MIDTLNILGVWGWHFPTSPPPGQRISRKAQSLLGNKETMYLEQGKNPLKTFKKVHK